MVGPVRHSAIPLLIVVGALACSGAGPSPPHPEGVLIALDPTTASLALIDVSSGETLASHGFPGERTWAVYRPSTGELLASTVDVRGREASLQVYDIDGADRPKWTLPMPDRAVSRGYALAMALSEDERYLYYLAHTARAQYPNWIGVIDLIAREEVARTEVRLPCANSPTVGPSGGSRAEVFCPPDRSVTVDPSGSVSELLRFPLPEEAIRSLSSPLARTGAGEVVLRGCPGGRAIPCRLGDGRRVLAYSPWDDRFLSGLLIYNEQDAAEARRIDLPDGIIHFTPVGSGTVALLEENTGTVHLFDVSSGKVTGELEVSPGTRWLFGP